MELIPVKTSEYPLLYGLMEDIWFDTFSSIISKEHIEKLLHKYFDVENIEKFASMGYEYYFIHDNVNVGLLVYADRGSDIFLDKVYIFKECRGKGYSSFAIKKVISLGKDVYLNVNKQNTHAIDVYKHIGFTVYEEVECEIAEGMINSDYVMKYTI